MQYIDIVYEDLTLFWGTKWVEEDNCGTNNVPMKILIKGTDVIPDIICRSTMCKPFIKVLEMQLISQMIDDTWELVVDTGIGLKDMFNLKITIEVIGHILQLKKHTNIATKHIILGQNLLELTPSHSCPHIISLVEPGRCNHRLHWLPLSHWLCLPFVLWQFCH